MPEPVVKLEKASVDRLGDATYLVWVDGRIVGHVYRRSEESWRKSGRLRTSMRGYARYWRAAVKGRPLCAELVERHGPRLALEFRGADLQTRGEAVELLLDWHLRRKPRERAERRRG